MSGIAKYQPQSVEISQGRKTSFTEVFGASVRHAAPLVSGGRQLENEINEPLINVLKDVMTDSYMPGGRATDVKISDDLEQRLSTPRDRMDDTLLTELIGELDTLGYEYPEAILPENRAARRAEMLEQTAQDRAREMDVIERGGLIVGPTASFIGGVGAEFSDPANVATIPLGAPGRLGILMTATIEGGINAGLEAAQTPSRNRLLREMGEAEESMLANALTGAIFGAAIPVTLSGIGQGAKGISTASAMASQAFRRKLANDGTQSNNPAVQAAAEAVLEDLNDEAAAVTNPSSDANAEHTARAQAATEAAQRGEVPEMPDRPLAAVPQTSRLVGGLEEVNPLNLEVRPAEFQFKSEADTAGVTPKLRDVTEWQPERAGVTVVFEGIDGRQAVADGHQRTALANRIMAADPSQKITMAARVYREADGFTAEDVRVIAAMKNIAEAADGMTSAMARDAAEILRVDPGKITDLPAGPGIGRARALAELSDDAFGMYINEVVPERFAEIVGRIVDQKELHAPIMGILSRTQPDTVAQATSIIEQAKAAPVVREEAQDLFGGEGKLESLYADRAKVLERAMKILREDRATFRTLDERAGSIEQAGSNKLDKKSNAQVRRDTETALEAVRKLAHRSGPISEALNDGAKTYREKGRLKDAAERVAESVRSEIGRNGIAGLGNGSGRPVAKSASPHTETPDPNEGFGEVENSEAAKAQVDNTRIEDAEPGDGLFDTVPIGIEKVDGEARAAVVSRADMAKDLDADDDAIQVLEACAI